MLLRRSSLGLAMPGGAALSGLAAAAAACAGVPAGGLMYATEINRKAAGVVDHDNDDERSDPRCRGLCLSGLDLS